MPFTDAELEDALKDTAPPAPKASPYAKPGPYVTQLSPEEEPKFQDWVKKGKIPFDPSPTSDYDMRGFWKAAQGGDPNAKTALSGFDGRPHFPDTFKTPYHKTFSAESRYATADAPKWDGDRLIGKDGKVIADETPKFSDADLEGALKPDDAVHRAVTGAHDLPAPEEYAASHKSWFERIFGMPKGPVQSSRGGRLAQPISEEDYSRRVEGQGGTPDLGLGDIIPGITRAGEGAHTVVTGKGPTGEPVPRVRGAREALAGAMDAGKAGLAAGAVAEPLVTALSLTGGAAAQAGTEEAAKRLGAGPDASGLAGDVAGLLVGGAAAHGLTREPVSRETNPQTPVESVEKPTAVPETGNTFTDQDLEAALGQQRTVKERSTNGQKTVSRPSAASEPPMDLAEKHGFHFDLPSDEELAAALPESAKTANNISAESKTAPQPIETTTVNQDVARPAIQQEPPRTAEAAPETIIPAGPVDHEGRPFHHAESPQEPTLGDLLQLGGVNTGPEPGTIARVKTSDLSVDPVRFQFKQQGVGKGGVTDEFDQVRKFDPEKAGIISVWHDPHDGKTYVVNGHHRYEMAERLGAPELDVRYLRADTAAEARTKGALINIAEGRGDALDAAKVFRDSGLDAKQLEAEGVSLKGEKARKGLALANLDPYLFRKVVEGDIPVDRAAVIGEGLENPDDQRALFDTMQASEKNGKRLTNDQVAEMIRLANHDTAKATETQESLFGSEQVTRSLIKEKAEVSDYIRKRLSQEKRLFEAVGNERAAGQLKETGNVIKAEKNAETAERTNQAQALYDKLSTSAGDVSDALNKAAAELASGETSNEVKERAYRDIKRGLIEQADRLSGRKTDAGSKGNARGRAREAGAGERDSAGTAPPEVAASATPHGWDSVERSVGEPEGTKPAVGVAHELPELLRDLPYVTGADLAHHENMAHAEPIELKPEDAKHTAAYVVNQNMIELIGRGLSRLPDDRAGTGIAGLHMGAASVRKSYKILSQLSQGDERSGYAQLLKLMRDAASKNQGVVMVGDHSLRTLADRQKALNEELNHARQQKLNPGEEMTRHGVKTPEGGGAGWGLGRLKFMETPLASQALNALARSSPDLYGKQSMGQMMAEIGVRLMDKNRFRELGLSLGQARTLAADYIKTLRKEYGNEKPREIAKHAFDALDFSKSQYSTPDVRTTEFGKRAQRRAASESVRPEGEQGAGERAQPSVSEGTAGGDAGDTARPRNARRPAAGSLFDEAELKQPENETIRRDRETNAAKQDALKAERETIAAREETERKTAAAKAEASRKAAQRPDPEFDKARKEALDREAENDRYHAQLTKDRLESQLKGPISAEENQRKLKKRKETQFDMFGPEARDPEQGSLFSASAAQPEDIRKFASLAEMRALKAKRDAALTELDRARETPDQSKFGERVLHYFTGERDMWGARVNQVIEKVRRTLSVPEQEALSLMRDFKNKPQELEQWKNGTHPALEHVEDLEAAKRNIARLKPAIELAQNPTEGMKAADQVLTKIAAGTLREGQRLGFLESRWTPDEYNPHILHPKGEGEVASPPADRIGRALGGKIGRYFAFAETREFPTMLDALAANIKPKTLNALDAFTIHGDKFATARASHLLVNELRDTGVGKWGTKETAPEGWTEIAPHAHPFQNTLALNNAEGLPVVAKQTLFVPKYVEKALRPITDPDYMSYLPGFRKLRVFQAYTKAVQLGLSMFHATTENYMALANMGASGWVKGLRADRFSDDFQAMERHMIANGGTSAVQGKTVEAYKSLQPGSIPTWSDIFRSLPAVKQMDRFAEKFTDFTFNNLQRRFKVTDYAMKRAAWLSDHMEATPSEEAAAMHSITKELNAVYGGLHTENLGINKAATEIGRAVMLAPDWTFSNVFNVKYAFEGGKTPAGRYARAFWMRQMIGGMAATEMLSLALSGKASKNPTQVYFGKDDKAKDIYQNVFFKGVSGDVINLVHNVTDFGAVQGLARSLTGKAAPLVRAGLQLATNRDFLGRTIVPKGMNPVAGTARAAYETGKALAPIPLSAGNAYDMLVGPHAKDYKLPEMFTTLFAGTPPRHVKPETGAKPTLPWIKQLETGKVRPGGGR